MTDGAISIPVLMYHHVNPHRGDRVTVTPKAFFAQMHDLAREGVETLAVTDLMAFLEGRRTPPERCVVITFDDGWLDNYLYAFPVLKSLGLKAAFFLVTDRVLSASRTEASPPASVPSHEESKRRLACGRGAEVALSWPQIEEMRSTGLAEFHPHSVSHQPCDELSAPRLRQELAESRRVIQEHLGETSSCFCWPYGRWNAETRLEAPTMGYRFLFTTDPGFVTGLTDPGAIPRIEVGEETNLLHLLAPL